MPLKLGGRVPPRPKRKSLIEDATDAIIHCHVHAKAFLGRTEFLAMIQSKIDRRRVALENPKNQQSSLFPEKEREYDMWLDWEIGTSALMKLNRQEFEDTAKKLNRIYADLREDERAEVQSVTDRWTREIPQMLQRFPRLALLDVWRALLPTWGTAELEDESTCPF